jgi:formylglycine-generating enzyme required for sulfatase activity
VTGRRNGPNRGLRGGSFNNNNDNLHASDRNNNNPNNENNNIGFRVSKAPELPGGIS